MGPDFGFSLLSLTIPPLPTLPHFLWTSSCYILYHLLTHLSSQSGNLSSINISISFENKPLDGPLQLLTFGFGVYTTILSPSRLKHDHPACFCSGSAWTYRHRVTCLDQTWMSQKQLQEMDTRLMWTQAALIFFDAREEKFEIGIRFNRLFRSCAY